MLGAFTSGLGLNSFESCLNMKLLSELVPGLLSFRSRSKQCNRQLHMTYNAKLLFISPNLFWSWPNPQNLPGKLGQQSAIYWNSLGLDTHCPCKSKQAQWVTIAPNNAALHLIVHEVLHQDVDVILPNLVKVVLALWKQYDVLQSSHISFTA